MINQNLNTNQKMSLVEKYNISEKDAYTLAEIEILKDKEGLLSLKKEKLKA